ncbi:hypothetical protein ABT354_12505 [Streptomyces sp. NPDC000594]|uniref:hypothetical protein n=1 Tax=Streptomyces sp. NPDC000594 TaxID=3154261 RepID=UPI003323E41D
MSRSARLTRLFTVFTAGVALALVGPAPDPAGTAAPAAPPPADRLGRAPAVLLATFHLEENFGGGAWPVYGDPCRQGGDIRVIWRVPAAFNDAISSVRTFHNCRARVAEHGDLRGAQITLPSARTVRMPAGWNNRTSSLMLIPVG